MKICTTGSLRNIALDYLLRRFLSASVLNLPKSRIVFDGEAVGVPPKRIAVLVNSNDPSLRLVLNRHGMRADFKPPQAPEAKAEVEHIPLLQGRKRRAILQRNFHSCSVNDP